MKCYAIKNKNGRYYNGSLFFEELSKDSIFFDSIKDAENEILVYGLLNCEVVAVEIREAEEDE